jgi:hypothetical protein
MAARSRDGSRSSGTMETELLTFSPCQLISCGTVAPWLRKIVSPDYALD